MFKSFLFVVATTLAITASAQEMMIPRLEHRQLQTTVPVAIPVTVPVVLPVAAPVAVPTPPPSTATKAPKSAKKAKSPSAPKVAKKAVAATFRGERLEAGSGRKLRMYQNNLA